MYTLNLTIMLVLAVLVSNLVSKLLPRICTPLVQIALGAALSLVVHVPNDFELPTTLFMALFVAPLVYDESRGIDRLIAWRNRRTILKLAIGLVVATTLVTGVVMGTVVPQLSVAAAIALGAALSPTDPVAVSALGGSTSISPRQRAVLSAESIVNDATGVVVFDLAIAAALTGAFSLGEAVGSFAFLFFGGILVGLVLGVAFNAASRLIVRLGYDDTVFHVLYDVAVPFVTFFASEGVHVSPIMAVMVCALVFKVGTGQAGVRESRMNIVSNSVWSVLSFCLNGIVFVMLGFELTGSIEDIGMSGMDPALLAAASALLVVVVVGTRFAWIAVQELLTRRAVEKRLRRDAQARERLEAAVRRAAKHGRGAESDDLWPSNLSVVKNAAILTFAGGAKGAVTMSIALSVPYTIASRSLIVFLVSVAIISTVVLANVLMPLLSPAPRRSAEKAQEEEKRAKLDVLRRVVERLSAESTDENAMATQLAVADINRRIEGLMADLPDEDYTATRRAVRAFALELEGERCSELMEAGEVSDDDGYAYLNRLGKLADALDHHGRMRWVMHRNLRRARGVAHLVAGLTRERFEEAMDLDNDGITTMRELRIACNDYVIEQLGEEVSRERFPVEDVTHVMLDYQHSNGLLGAESPSVTVIAKRGEQKERILLKGIAYEIEGIEDAFDEGLISRETARKLKDDAYLMRLDLENRL